MPDPKEATIAEPLYDPNKYYVQFQPVREEKPKESEHEQLPNSFELVEDPNED